jgi:hypothetical protein
VFSGGADRTLRAFWLGEIKLYHTKRAAKTGAKGRARPFRTPFLPIAGQSTDQVGQSARLVLQ